MEDFILREIDKIGQMLAHIARRLGLLKGEKPDYSLGDVKSEFTRANCPIDIDTVLKQENPILYLTENEKLTEQALESFIEILFYSDIDESKKQTLLKDAINYLDNKGYISFKLHSFVSPNEG